jgi:hypothetical protein|tara:strand:- start:242 stop:463 length:222 start_codon:yes stop_codon:yes gene_type:complete
MSKGYEVKKLPTREEELSSSFFMRTKEYNNLINTINFLVTELGTVLIHDINPDSPQKIFIETHPEIFKEIINE